MADQYERPNTGVEWWKRFNDHLDGCEQCRNHPFALCPKGATILTNPPEELDQEIQARMGGAK